MSYCTREDVKSHGGSGSTAELDAAIVVAMERVDRYCGEWFELRAATLQLRVDEDGIARAHKRIESVTSVTFLGAPSPLLPSAYAVSSSKTSGGRDRIVPHGAFGWADVTVLGAEPWNGGWSNLLRQRELTVVGTFGWADTPAGVREATAIIAAQVRSGDVDSEIASQRADEEGNVLPVVPGRVVVVDDRAPLRARTTGSAQADALLAPFIREPVRVRA